MKFWLPLAILIALSAAASAMSDVSGYFGGNGNFYQSFTGRNPPLVGSIGQTGGGPPPTCAGVIDASVGCPLPMLGM
jgi:hypothetical protein